MNSLSILRANKALVKTIKLKARKLKTSPMSVAEHCGRIWSLPQPTYNGIISITGRLINLHKHK